jgi:hypothetical protein
MPWLEFWVVQDMDGFESADVSMAVDLLNWMEMEKIKQARQTTFAKGEHHAGPVEG